MMNVFRSISIVFLVLVFTQCKTIYKTQMGLLSNKTWELETLGETAVNPENFPNGIPTLEFKEAGYLAGFTGCNNFSGIYSLEGKDLKLNPGAMTEKACPGIDENDFIEALQNVTKFTGSKNKINLLGEAGTLMSFISKN